MRMRVVFGGGGGRGSLELASNPPALSALVILLWKGHVPAMSHLCCFHHITHTEDYLQAFF